MQITEPKTTQYTFLTGPHGIRNTSTEPLPETVHVLVVDDEKSIRLSLRKFLTDAGYEVACAATADEARFFISHSGEIKYYRIIRNYVPGLPQVRGDFQQLNQAFINLIMNASHAMKNARQKILYLAAGKKPESGRLYLSVGDTGSGIAPDQLGRIFDPFHTTRRGEGGTGLGLPVVKSIVERHGGDIEVSSEPGIGSTFIITLPVHGSLAGNNTTAPRW